MNYKCTHCALEYETVVHWQCPSIACVERRNKKRTVSVPEDNMYAGNNRTWIEPLVIDFADTTWAYGFAPGDLQEIWRQYQNTDKRELVLADYAAIYYIWKMWDFMSEMDCSGLPRSLSAAVSAQIKLFIKDGMTVDVNSYMESQHFAAFFNKEHRNA